MKTPKSNILKILSTMCLGLCGLFSGHVFCGNIIYTNALRGARVKQDTTFSVSANGFNYTNANATHIKINARLFLAEDRWIARTANATYQVIYQLTLTNRNNTTTTLTDTLVVNYKTTGAYTDEALKSYPNYKAAKLKVLSINGMMPEDVFLELQLEIDQFSIIDTLSKITTLRGGYQYQNNTLLLTWDDMLNAETYDVEWLFIDNPSHKTNIGYDFRNATRINTSNNYYAISLTCPKGNILYRVRPVGVYRNATLEMFPQYGNWSNIIDKGTSLPDTNRSYRYDFVGLEDSLVWQHNAVYTEEGKRKEVLSIYDGSLRQRQQITLNNSTQVAIIGETFYDYIGRPALQAIPAATPSQGFRYYGTANGSTGQFSGLFPKTQYDRDLTITHALPFPSNQTGSAQYYSDQNPFYDQPHWLNVDWTPADSGYTYGHTRYVNDGTDRIHSQSNAGEGFGLGSGKDTRYFYGNPMQTELDRLFGNEAGDASHYQKVMSVDANGVTTASYYDNKERLIASAMADGGANNLLPIDDAPDAQLLTEYTPFNNDSRIYTRNIVVAMPTQYYFDYSITPAQGLYDTCSGQIGCINCRYKVVLSLWNPELLSYIFRDSTILSQNQTFSHTQTLLPGNYQLYKSVTLVDDTITDAQYALYYDRVRPCVVYPRADTARCYTVCQEYCMFVNNLPTPDSNNVSYMNCVKECENPPQHGRNGACEAQLNAMLRDMSPGGQYFDNIHTYCPGDTNSYDKPNINGFLLTICQEELNQDTALVSIRNFLGATTFNNAFWNAMRYRWQHNYAAVMLKHHPEYHLYKMFCDCGNGEEQAVFDSLFININTQGEAKELGLFNPLHLAFNDQPEIVSIPNTGYQPIEGGYLDPSFDPELSCCENVGEMIDYISQRMLGYMSWQEDGITFYISIWFLLFDPDGIAQGNWVPHCDSIIDIMQNMQNVIIPQWITQYQCSEDDARWRLFKSMYYYLREEAKYRFLSQCVSKNCYEPDFQWNQYEWWARTYPIEPDYCEMFLKADTGCTTIPLTMSAGGGSTQANFQIRYMCNPLYGIVADSLNVMADTAIAEMYKDCNLNCEAYSYSWMEELHDYFLTHCPDVLKDSLSLENFRMSLVNICQQGCEHCQRKRNFTVIQLVDSGQFEELLGNFCTVAADDYTRIVYPRPQDYYIDCDCDNYQLFLNSYDLTFWSDANLIGDSLALEGIMASINDINQWNSFCVWQRYNLLLNRDDDTTFLMENNFPSQFKCSPAEPLMSQCQQEAILAAASTDTVSFYLALDSTFAAHRNQYRLHCMENVNEYLDISCTNGEMLYTLYYYDQADNLIRTVPPNGVKIITEDTTLHNIYKYRKDIARYDTLKPGFVHPNHSMISNYRYNTRNQPIQTHIPDHDTITLIYYDILSRPALSQNPAQMPHQYSYTLYDALGRITEIGLLENPNYISRSDVANPTILAAFIASSTRTQVTKTTYDIPFSDYLTQHNLRNRIAAVSYQDTNALPFSTATLYSYDMAGNVKRLIQNIPDLSPWKRDTIFLDYEYDLLSGNVNKVWFQKGKHEQFMHRYRYDADNRLTHVYTSALNLREKLESKYYYLPTGQLTRMELGAKQIQGVDYAYKLQGWLKIINGLKDIGQDGNVYYVSNPNAVFPRDAFTSVLYYYNNDFAPLFGSFPDLCNYAQVPSLYNGNIAALSTEGENNTRLLKVFQYDKINRIKKMKTTTWNLNTGTWETYLSDIYATDYEYDYNGNLTFLQRLNFAAYLINFFNYDYSYGNNRLDQLNSGVPYYIPSSIYTYDPIGNLLNDSGKNLSITWNNAGKVSKHWTVGDTVKLQYNPLGQRQRKQTATYTDFYLHDATGNIMAIYRQAGDSLKLTERPIYGNNRLGEFKQQLNLGLNGVLMRKDSGTIGLRQYELTDHLGNVTATFLDRKILSNNTYYPLEIGYTDYYPFGYPIYHRSNNLSSYRFGFNGQESDNEVYGDKQSYTAEFWQYDSRLGRRWNVDPKLKPWESPYATFGDNPINAIDPDGRAGIPVINKENKTITVNSQFIFYGGSASAELSKSIATEIATQYNGAGGKVTVDGVEYSVNFNITYQTVTEAEATKMAEGNTNAELNFVRVEKNNSRMNRSFFELGGNSGFMNTDDNLGTSTTAPHEVGHGYGLNHSAGDQRGQGQPDIMSARGTLVDPQYQYNPQATAGAAGGTINPATRKVTQQNITDMFKGVRFDTNGRGQIGTTTNTIYNANGN